VTESRDVAENHLVEIWFRIQKDEDGFPESKDWEALLCSCVRFPNQFQVKSVPFYVKGIAVADIVSVTETNEGYYEFEGVISRGGHIAYRLFVEKAPWMVEQELENLGCAVETTANNKLLAVDIPSDRVNQVRDHLLKGLQSGRWELQEAYDPQ